MGDIFIKDLPLSRTFDESDSIIKEDTNGTKQTYFKDLRDNILPTPEREQIETNKEDINKLKGMIGSPLVAKTSSEMTDTTHIYVYVGSESGFTNGNWYYYDGQAWVSGGVYNSSAVDTDTTLTVSGKAADAKATGDAIQQVKAVVDQINSLTFALNIEDKGLDVTYTYDTETE